MKEIKHTPGPWQLRGRSVSGPLGVSIGYASQSMVCGINGSYSISEREAEANSHLICAAPDMAEVLEMIAADADAGEILMTSGIRLAIDAALIKAGRKAAPVREGE